MLESDTGLILSLTPLQLMEDAFERKEEGKLSSQEVQVV